MKYFVLYTPAKSYHFKGNSTELRTEMKRNHSYIVSGSNNSYILSCSACGYIIQLSPDNTIRRRYPIKFIRDYYHKSEVTENDFYRLKHDLEIGKVKFSDLY